MSEACSVIILAGGFGRRLGRDKATAIAGGRPLLHWSAIAAAQVTDDIVVARRPDQQLPPLEVVNWREAVDYRHDRGPLAGLEASLPSIRHDLAVAVACDMPLLQPDLLRAVADACGGVEIAMPYLDEVAQPLLAAYRPSVAAHARRLLDDGDGRVRALLPLVEHKLLGEADLRRIDPELESFTNINRPEDLTRVEQILNSRTRMGTTTSS
ncbi:MAG: molybdenum cofactor guanylyltransferase [Chloroflexi bacterium]|nr:molybdenum cofactor guanylyltransferase [Chloroflexota bacterium]